MTPEQRSMRARIAAHARWAKTGDRSSATAAARRAFAERWERQVDPDGVLDPDERARRAEHAERAHFQRMAFKASYSRARRKRAA